MTLTDALRMASRLGLLVLVEPGRAVVQMPNGARFEWRREWPTIPVR